MSLQCGIVGLPNVGKSTLFNCLSNAKAQSANFPFCTIEPNVGVITVPDERLNKLVEMCQPRSVVPATVEIVDIAGLVKGASKGEGLGNKFLANIRETDAIIHVLRCFDDDNITHVDGTVDPVRDKEIIDYELQLKDLETIEGRIARTQKQAQTGGDKVAKMQYEVLKRFKDALDQGKPARSVELETPDSSSPISLRNSWRSSKVSNSAMSASVCAATISSWAFSPAMAWRTASTYLLPSTADASSTLQT